MNKNVLFLLAALMVVASVYSAEAADDLVWVKGGTFNNTNSAYSGKNVTLSSFYLGKYLVTEKEWMEVMSNNPSQFKGDNLPVEMVDWYDCIEYCDRRSTKEGLKPYYNIDQAKKDPDNTNDLDDIKWTVTFNAGANGYRLPTEAEWEYAAEGGRKTMNYTYSGGNDAGEVAWYWRNAGDKYLNGFWDWHVIEMNYDRPKRVGGKPPNELDLYDMSGNVREWCWDWFGDLESNVTDPRGSHSGAMRVWKGGGWIGDAFCCASSFRGQYEPYNKAPDQGFRVCRGR